MPSAILLRDHFSVSCYRVQLYNTLSCNIMHCHFLQHCFIHQFSALVSTKSCQHKKYRDIPDMKEVSQLMNPLLLPHYHDF